MRRTILAFSAIAALVSATGATEAADPFTIQLKWVTQSQFAGYFVAAAKGFYEEEGLDVTIKPGGPDIAPPQVIAAGGADVIVEWMPAALAAREKGVPLVNVAQIFDRSGMMLTCKKESGVSTPADFKGKTLGVWFSGNEYPFLAWMGRLGYTTTGSLPDVTVLRQGFNVDPLLQNQAACISTMIYNEYWQVIDAGVPKDDLVTFFYSDQGVATLEDGLYATEDKLADPAYVDKLARFLRASVKGWAYARANPVEAGEIVVEADPAGATTEEVQIRQMENVATLITVPDARIGWLDPAAYQQTVATLLASGSDPVITRDPGAAAWSHDAWDKAMGR
jgi:NitT/TauT family transport system substrate-binding protein